MERDLYSFTSEYLTKGGEPWFPVMGEIHYSRYPKEFWKESIYKMKSGGVDIVSTYVFWLHHEEIQGEYDFTGQRDLRSFIETVKECGLVMFLRIGPWCHGEARNGGLPDWLLKQPYEVRTNDERYFAEVHKYYSKIFEQTKGLLWKDGGPVIGVQIENEYGHCGGLQGEEGEAHMRRLKQIAMEAGFQVPYYTATGWGGAVTGGMIPVMGGYCDAPWDPRTTEIEPSGNYVFTYERNDHNIGNDYGIGTGITFDINRFPFLTAELGGGLQVTRHRRPIAHPTDIGAMSLVKLGCGVNLLGYYMYHGGTNPEGKLTTLQESKATGYNNDLPAHSYDFFAPIREFGQMSDTLKEIKLWSMFLHEWGREFCEMKVHYEDDAIITQWNHQDLRTVFRNNGACGYLFVNNYQRRVKMKDHHQVILTARLDQETVEFPAMDVMDRDYFFFPVNMKLGEGVLQYATATPLTRIQKGETSVYFFYGDHPVKYRWKQEDKKVQIVTLSRRDALQAWKVRLDQEYVILSEDGIIEDGNGGYTILQRNNRSLRSFPELSAEPEGYKYAGEQDGLHLYEYTAAKTKPEIEEIKDQRTEYGRRIEVTLIYAEGLGDCFLRLDLVCDTAKLFIENHWAGDHFYSGEPWEIGLKRFGFPRTLVIELYSLREDADIYLEERPDFDHSEACELKRLQVFGEWNCGLRKGGK